MTDKEARQTEILAESPDPPPRKRRFLSTAEIIFFRSLFWRRVFPPPWGASFSDRVERKPQALGVLDPLPKLFAET